MLFDVVGHIHAHASLLMYMYIYVLLFAFVRWVAFVVHAAFTASLII